MLESLGGAPDTDDDRRARRRRALVGGPAVLLVAVLVAMSLCVGVGWYVSDPVLELLHAGNECDAAPDEPDRIAAEKVFQQPPSGAAAADQPATWQPCELESDITGGRRVSFTSALSHDDITRHYRGLAQASHWRLVPDRSAAQVGLVDGRKWTRHRCLWLHVVRDEGDRRGVYVVQISFWPQHQRSFCD
jgi:hypothetical protein